MLHAGRDRMPQTIDEDSLGLRADEIEREVERQRLKRERQVIRRRSIEFDGELFDTGDPEFSGRILEVVADRLSKNDSWFRKSRELPRLVEFGPNRQGVNGPSSPHGNGSRRKRLPPAQRQAMGQISELVAFEYLKRRHEKYVDEDCWISENRSKYCSGELGDDSAGYDFRVHTPSAKWYYEVKSSLEESCEFEMTANEIRVASKASKDRTLRYRILYIPFVLEPNKWSILELHNPLGEKTRNKFLTVQGSVRFRFKCS